MAAAPFTGGWRVVAVAIIRPVSCFPPLLYPLANVAWPLQGRTCDPRRRSRCQTVARSAMRTLLRAIDPYAPAVDTVSGVAAPAGAACAGLEWAAPGSKCRPLHTRTALGVGGAPCDDVDTEGERRPTGAACAAVAVCSWWWPRMQREDAVCGVCSDWRGTWGRTCSAPGIGGVGAGLALICSAQWLGSDDESRAPK